jgi:hypothetical protein
VAVIWQVRRRSAGPDGEAGVGAAQALLAVAIGWLLLVALANLVVMQYGQAAVRAALTTGVQAGRPADATASDCQRAAQRNALDNLLGGTMGDQVTIRCAVVGAGPTATIQATATGTFQGWFPPIPDWHFQFTAHAVKEQLP